MCRQTNTRLVSMKEKRLYIVQPALISYRVPFFQQIIEKTSHKIQVFYGEHSTSKAVFSDTSDYPWSTLAKNKWYFNRKLVYQVLPLKKVIHAELVVLNLNPRFIHNWIILIIRKLMARQTLLWGHLHSQTGKSSYTNKIRHLQIRLSNGLILYTQTEEDNYRSLGLKQAVKNLGNSCVFAKDCATSENTESSTLTDIIYVGRLSPAKRPDLLFDAFSQLSSIYPELRLVIVGGGEEEENLKQKHEKLIKEKRILMKGWIWSNDELRPLYSKSLFSVTSGFAGLNVIQSFAHGVPTIVARDEPHSPEIEACIDGFNTLYFNKGSVDSLCDAMKQIIRDKSEWISRRSLIAKRIQDNYTFEGMASKFCSFIEDFAGGDDE